MDTLKLDDDPEIIGEMDARSDENASDKTDTESDSQSDIDSSDDDDDDQELSPKKTKKRFDKIISELKAGKDTHKLKCGGYVLTDPDDLRRFLDQHDDLLYTKSSKGMTLLHLIAEEDKDDMPRVKKMEGLIKALIKSPQDLLAMRDEDGKTPLFCAVANRNHKLIKAMCEAHDDISSVLKIPKSINNTTQSANCIHEAISRKSSSRDDDPTMFLINKADEDTLLARDENGLTPLFLAVEYKRCDEGQLRVIETLVNKCPQSLDQTYKHAKKGMLSPYLYLELSRSQAQAKFNLPKESVRKSVKLRVKELHPTQHKREMSENRQSDDLFLRSLSATRSSSVAPIGKFSSEFNMLDGSRDPVTATMRVHDSNNKTPNTTANIEKSKDKEKKSSSRSSKSPKIRVAEASVENIKKWLRLYYLRHRSHDAAVEFLYGLQPVKQIYFDLAGIAPKVTRTQMLNGLSHAAFEDILQYVAIPLVEITDNPAKVKSEQRVHKPDGMGRADLKHLFFWLRNDKKVKTILKIIVEDLQEPAHSDEAIESCLIGMGVDVWDWKKRDLSPDVLHRVAPNVRVVHLYWSGNNAILRAWSEPEGLRKLRNLTRVYLHTEEGLETGARTDKNIKEFKDRMNQDQTKEILIENTKFRGGLIGPLPKSINTARDPYERHRWITSMEEYAYFLKTAENEARVEASEGQRQSLYLEHPVTVAIIDDGIDVNDPTFHSRIVDGRSFCSRDEEQNLNQPYYVSGSGHGTAMAKLICKICPNVKLYILRLDEYVTETGKRQITAKSAAKAVRAAITKEVDIISMSWTVEKTDNNTEDIKALEKEIGRAADEDILMFCASADQGAYKDRTYPAATSTKNIFKIGAAEATGATLRSVGDEGLVDFIFPGHQVVMEQVHDPKVKNYTALTGSSVATALAVGLAAVILYTVQLAEVSKRSTDLRGYRSLKNHEGMRIAFSQIGTTKESNHKYITVWDRFTQVIKEANKHSSPKDDWIKHIRALAVEFLRVEDRISLR
ncbi:hypothetical protein F5Y10DRAFT_238742 [Nemania abortiva]|nr:hypothetical protein F5Y10DRAFT_238742 [Nemania abortiva]